MIKIVTSLLGSAGGMLAKIDLKTWVIIGLVFGGGCQQKTLTKWRTKASEYKASLEQVELAAKMWAGESERNRKERDELASREALTVERIIYKTKRVELPASTECTAAVDWLRVKLPEAQPW